MRKIFFNWHELTVDGEDNFTAILLLTFCLFKGYNSIIAINPDAKFVKQNLKIEHFPPSLFKKGYLQYRYKTGHTISKYKCRVPTSYFRNHTFLYTNVPIDKKITYLYMLAQRPISDKNNFIIQDAVADKFWDNPFIIHKDGKLHFILEKTD